MSSCILDIHLIETLLHGGLDVACSHVDGQILSYNLATHKHMVALLCEIANDHAS